MLHWAIFSKWLLQTAVILSALLLKQWAWFDLLIIITFLSLPLHSLVTPSLLPPWNRPGHGTQGSKARQFRVNRNVWSRYSWTIWRCCRIHHAAFWLDDAFASVMLLADWLVFLLHIKAGWRCVLVRINSQTTRSSAIPKPISWSFVATLLENKYTFLNKC